MKAKKIIAVILAAALFVSAAAGCSNDNGQQPDTSDSGTAGTPDGPEVSDTSEEAPAPAPSEELVVFDDSGVTITRAFTVDGNNALSDESKLYDGLGMVSANNSSRLLLDYKAEHPDVYQALLEYMFGKDGMGLSLIKVEMGADVDSSSGTEPAVMRSENEETDVTRGAGYQLVADALKINPDIKVDMLYWGQPAWVANAEDSYDALYKWYKSTIDAMYDTYGIKVTHVTVNQNERAVDYEWVKYFSNRLKEETDERYDYDTIKIVCGEAVGTWGIAGKMLDDEELMDAIDVVTSHYTSWTNDNVKTLQNEYGKKVWFSEGSSPMSYAEATYRYDGTGSGMSDINGMLDIATRITQAMAEGMTMYEFQPVISAYYSGVTYFPKQLITANEPWSGAYSLDAGFYMCLHFSQFIDTDWQYIDGARFGDGTAGGDGHAIVDSTYNYIALVNENKENASIILVNNSAETIKYDIELANLPCAENNFYVWETRGPDSNDYYENFFKKLGYITAEDGTLKVVVKPYSMMTISTVNAAVNSYEEKGTQPLTLPYTDDFDYSDYDADYLAGRGSAPRYTTDQGGAFEVADMDGNNVLMQIITNDIKPKDWGSTSNPITNLGDDRWSNYSVSIDAGFQQGTAEDENVFVGIGARYNLADNNQSGYWLKLWRDGKCEIIKDNKSVAEVQIADFNTADIHNIKITVYNNIIEGSVDGETLLSYEDTEKQFISGRAAIYSTYHNNYFDNLTVESVDGYETFITRLDDLDAELTYSEGSNIEGSGGWYHNTMSSYKNYNRTCSDGYEGDTVEFSFSGSAFAVLGQTGSAVISIEIDGEIAQDSYECAGDVRKASYCNFNLEGGEHTVKITVVSGTFEIDAVEYQ